MSTPTLPIFSVKGSYQKEADGPEYRLFLTPVTKETDQSRVTELVLETTRQFAAFRYELGVSETRDASSLVLTVTGLRPPKLTLPASGPAMFRKEYNDLSGPYTVTVIGLNGKEATFRAEITETSVRILKPPSDPFLEVTTAGKQTR